LIKNVSRLLPTYQIRLLTFLARERGKKVVISLPKSATLDDALKAFLRENRNTISIDRT
jgi:hypothetical protein